MAHENAWPTQVLTLSMNSRVFCMADFSLRKKTPSGVAGWCLVSATSGFLRCGLGRGFAEIVVVGHARIDVVVQVVAHCALGKDLLRLLDLAEDRVVLAL